MEKIKNYLQNKSIGYYIAAADVALALITAIFYFATFGVAIGNNAAGHVPESIGIFLLTGALAQAALCLLPQYRFLSLIPVALFGAALFKEIYLVPDFFAGLSTGIEYNGGNAALNIIYLILLIIICAAAIVAAFMGYYKDSKDELNDFKDIKTKKNMIKICSGAGATLVAILVSAILIGNLNAGAAGQKKDDKKDDDDTEEKITFNPVTDEIKAACEAYDYSFKPEEVIIKQQETYDYSDATLAALTKDRTRDGQNIVYAFEGTYSEGYQGAYNEYYIYMWLWDDGIYFGTSTSNNSYSTWKGFWYNSSLTDGKDESGADIADCLVMVADPSKYSNYQSIICEPSSGFYAYQAYVYFNPGFASRSIIANGYYYYPTVALAIDSGSKGVEFNVGDKFASYESNSKKYWPIGWTVHRILKNGMFGACYNFRDLDTGKDNSVADYKLEWTYPEGMLENGMFAAAGTYDLVAKWGNLEVTITVTVK